MTYQKPRRRNRYTAFVLIGVAVAMAGVAYSAVPLYRLFCQALSIPQAKIVSGPSVYKAPLANLDPSRTVLIRFTANIGKGTPVLFSPHDFSIRVPLGTPILTAYQATNTSPLGINGVAVHMLFGMGGAGEDDVAKYIDLQQCFCFELQYYPAGQMKLLPLSFLVSPDLPKEIHTITFSYTLFKALPNDPRIKQKRPEDS